MAKKKGKPVEVSAEKKARAVKMHQEGKSYKAIADALNLGYDKAAWNLVNSGPTGKKRGDKKTQAAPVKGKEGPRKAAPADKGVEAAGRSRNKGKSPRKAPQKPPAGPPPEEGKEAPAQPMEGPRLKLGSMGKSTERPVAYPPKEVRAVPKPKDRKAAQDRAQERIGKLAKQ